MKIQIKTDHPVAYRSNDHLNPYGIREGAHRNPRFNFKLYKLWPFRTWLSILDVGCGGGQFVLDCFNAGHDAMGIDGSDWSRLHRRAAWRSHPELLFTADVTKWFKIMEGDKRKQFDVITTWETFEHIEMEDVAPMIAYLAKHLKKDGIWINSINGRSCNVGGVEYHRTIRTRTWWLKKFEEAGLVELKPIHRYFAGQWVAGPRQGYCKGSFHIVVGHKGGSHPRPRFSLVRWLYDHWKDSLIQKFLCCDF